MFAIPFEGFDPGMVTANGPASRVAGEWYRADEPAEPLLATCEALRVRCRDAPASSASARSFQSARSAAGRSRYSLMTSTSDIWNVPTHGVYHDVIANLSGELSVPSRQWLRATSQEHLGTGHSLAPEAGTPDMPQSDGERLHQSSTGRDGSGHAGRRAHGTPGNTSQSVRERDRCRSITSHHDRGATQVDSGPRGDRY